MGTNHLVFYILFPIFFILTSLIFIFYLDLANGPMVFLFVEILILILFLVSSILLINQRKLIRFIPFLSVIILSIIVCIISHPSVKVTKAIDGKDLKETKPMGLKNGLVKGLYTADGNVEVYAGIPYAEAPIGNLRWKEPVPKKNWDGVLDCRSFAPISYQKKENSVTNTIVDMYAEKGWHPDYHSYPLKPISEDSLYLNIFKPAGDVSNLPIVVYIHGGSLTSGSSYADDIYGETFARGGVIMITIAYRLGVFGYFAHPDLIKESPNSTTGNYGLLDQIEALKWVNDNAAYFGGDKNNITIAGESAGSSSVSALCVSPLSKGLFKRAIGESSSIIGKYPPHTWRKMEEALEVGEDIMKEMGCKTIEELRNIPASKLVNTKFTNSSMTIDGYSLIELPNLTYEKGLNNEEALLNGYNIKEADAFVVPTMLFSPINKNNIKDRLISYFDEEAAKCFIELYKDEIEKDAFKVFNEIISCYWFYMPHYEWSNMAYNNGVKVYRYQFTKENGYYGTYHSGEIIYAYGNIYRSNKQFAYDDSDVKLSNIMVQYWLNFIKTGNPNNSLLPNWEIWNPSDNNLIELGDNIHMFEEKVLKTYEIIEKWNERTKD